MSKKQKAKQSKAKQKDYLTLTHPSILYRQSQSQSTSYFLPPAYLSI